MTMSPWAHGATPSRLGLLFPQLKTICPENAKGRSRSLRIENMHDAIAPGPDSRTTGIDVSHSQPWHDGLFRFGMPLSNYPGDDPTSRAQERVMRWLR
jgi:hypothetical protein